jgi:hypothetical protein
LRRNCLLRHVVERNTEGTEVKGRQEEVSSYWVALKKGEDTGN